MTDETRLKLSAIAFVLIWTPLMIWRTGTPLEPVPVLISLAAGCLAGVLWYWLYGKWFRWYFARR